MITTAEEFKGESNGVTFINAYAPTEIATKLRRANSRQFIVAAQKERKRHKRTIMGWHVYLRLINMRFLVEKPSLFVLMMDAKACTGKIGERGGKSGNMFLGTHGRHSLNDKGERLLLALATSTEQHLVLLNIFFRTLKRGVSYEFHRPNASKPHAVYLQKRGVSYDFLLYSSRISYFRLDWHFISGGCYVYCAFVHFRVVC